MRFTLKWATVKMKPRARETFYCRWPLLARDIQGAWSYVAATFPMWALSLSIESNSFEASCNALEHCVLEDHTVVRNTSGSFFNIDRARPGRDHAPNPNPNTNSNPDANHGDV